MTGRRTMEPTRHSTDKRMSRLSAEPTGGEMKPEKRAEYAEKKRRHTRRENIPLHKGVVVFDDSTLSFECDLMRYVVVNGKYLRLLNPVFPTYPELRINSTYKCRSWFLICPRSDDTKRFQYHVLRISLCVSSLRTIYRRRTWDL